jgi:chromosome segregation ATPase
MQGMIARTEWMAALSDAKAKQDEIQAMAKDMAWLQRQLSQAQEETNSARQETAQLRAEMSRMVRRSDFESAKELVSNLESIVATEAQKQRETIAALNLRIGSLEVEISHRETIMKVELRYPSFKSKFNLNKSKFNLTVALCCSYMRQWRDF